MTDTIPRKFKAFRIHDDSDGYRSGIEDIALEQLNSGDVTVKVLWSSINYKDALAATGKGRILRRFPLCGGIDLAGIVLQSSAESLSEGDEVIVTGTGLSELRDGGYAEYQRVDSRSVVPLPDGLSLRDTMALGTAGFTAALSLYRMEALGQSPDMGPVVVTGATGGVGSIAINILHVAGYDVHAITGKVDEFDYLESLGATQCISRKELYWGQKPLETTRWAGCIDNVGGDMLSGITRVIHPFGNIASCGLAGGTALQTTVMPFILRGVSLIGISSSNCPYPLRGQIWQRLASDWKPDRLEDIARNEVAMDDMEETFSGMMRGEALGRTIVRVGT